MRFLVEIGPPSALSSPTTKAAFFVAILIYIILPVLLVVWEYRLTCRGPKYGIYLLGGVLASFIIFGLYSAIVAAILLFSFTIAIYKKHHK